MAYVDSLTPHLFVPTAQRPVRAKVRQLRADTRVMPHSHPWAQVAISTTGVIQLTVDRGTYIVPPSRALWIPPGMEHAVTMVEDAEMRTLYFHQPRGRCGPAALGERTAPHGQAAWRQCRVLEVSDLLRAVVALPGSLGLSVVAEGIVTQAQADALCALGCHLGQGFLFAKPGPLPASSD